MLTVTLFGQADTTWNGASIDLLRRQTRALFYCLAVQAEPIAREQLCFLFWPDIADATARRNLTRLLTHLRRALPTPDILVTTPDAVSLNAGIVVSDAVTFERHLRQADRQKDAQLLKQAVDLYRGPFLSGFSFPDCAEYDNWLTDKRRAFERQYLQALTTLIDHTAAQQELRSAIDYAHRYLKHDELDETVHRRLIELYAAAGDRINVERQFEACTTILERELGVDPLPETRAAYEAALAERPVPTPHPVPPLAWATLPGLDLPLVGRDDALAQLEDCYHKARAGSGSVVLISGEAGIGKSRLLQEFATRWETEALVLAGAGQPGEQALPYLPVTQVLRRGMHLSKGALHVDPIWLAEASLVLPELRTRYANLPAPMQTDPQSARTRLFEALTRITLGLGQAGRPLLLCFDDLHWTDSATLDWVAALCEHVRQHRLLLIGTYRREKPDAVSPLRRRLRRQNLLSEISLLGLEPESVHQLLHHADSSLGNGVDLAHKLQRTTGGNAFFLTETLRSLLGKEQHLKHHISAETFPVPETVYEAVSTRISQITPVARQVLEAGAVLGLNFSYPLIYETAGRTELETADGLDELVRVFMLREDGETFQFQHDIIRMVVYQGLSGWRQRLLHRRAAETLIAHSESANATSGQIAVHYEQAGLLHEALIQYRNAADWQRRIYANGEAIAAYQHLLGPKLTPLLSVEEQCQILLDRSEVWQIQSEFSRAEEDIRQALALAEQIGDHQLEARCQQALGNSLRLQSRFEEALPWLIQARTTLTAQDDKRALVRVLWTLAETYWFTGNYEEALTIVDEQALLATELADQRSLADGASTRGMIEWSLGRLDEAETSCLRSYELAKQIDHRWSMARAALTLGNIYSSRCNWVQALHWYGEITLPLTRHVGDRQCMSWALANIAVIYHQQGETERVLPYLWTCMTVYLQIGDLWAFAVGMSNVAEWYADQGDWEQAFHWIQRAIQLGKAIGADYYYAYMSNQADYHERCGEYAEALAVNDQVLSALRERENSSIGGDDLSFSAQTAEIRLKAALDLLDKAQAVSQINRLLGEYTQAKQVASIHYDIWRLNRKLEQNRLLAADLYRRLYEEDGTFDHRRRYEELTGEVLPDPPQLPSFDHHLPALSMSPQDMLAEIDEIIAGITSSQGSIE